MMNFVLIGNKIKTKFKLDQKFIFFIYVDFSLMIKSLLNMNMIKIDLYFDDNDELMDFIGSLHCTQMKCIFSLNIN